MIDYRGYDSAPATTIGPAPTSIFRNGSLLQRPCSLAPDVPAEPRLHHCGRRGADARHRDEHRDLHRRHAVLLKPGAVPDPDSLVMFMNTSPQGSGPAASPAKFAHWRTQTSVVQDAAAFRTGVVNYTGGEIPEQLRSGQVSATTSTCLAPRYRPRPGILAGRRSSERRQVVVISHGLWARRFGSDPNVIAGRFP